MASFLMAATFSQYIKSDIAGFQHAACMKSYSQTS